jgi:hypothetical protein
MLLLGSAERVQAQSIPVRALAPGRAKAPSKDDIPESHRPPSGMCRVWLENVPPSQQPAPTDCPSAIRNRPSNGRVIFPEDVPRVRRDDKGDDKGGDKGDDKGARGGDKPDRDDKKGRPRKPPEPTE